MLRFASASMAAICIIIWLVIAAGNLEGDNGPNSQRAAMENRGWEPMDRYYEGYRDGYAIGWADGYQIIGQEPEA